MKKRKKFLRILLITIILLVMLIVFNMFNNYIYATVDTDKYSDIYLNNNGGLLTIGGKILWIAQMIGTAVAVIALIVIGIQYVTKSPEQKAQVKDRLIVYAIGAAILFAATNLIPIIGRLAQGLFK